MSCSARKKASSLKWVQQMTRLAQQPPCITRLQEVTPMAKVRRGARPPRPVTAHPGLGLRCHHLSAPGSP